MKKKVSTRELMLLIILIVILVFYFIIKVPFANRQASLELERADVVSQINKLQPFINQMDKWQEELDQIYAEQGNNPKSIPNYNNINSVIAEMSVIFDGDTSYTINFSDPSFNDHIATRNIKITFKCEKYDEMIGKLVTINDSDNKYRITDLNISKESGDRYSVSLGLIAYEYAVEEEGQ